MSLNTAERRHVATGTDTAGDGDQMPAAQRVLAVCAHPDDESFGLGAVLATYAERAADVALLTLTAGEASTLGDERERLARQRSAELSCAVERLGISRSWLRTYPDGRLNEAPGDQLLADVQVAVDTHEADLLLVFDPAGITGHRDHKQATEAALLAACGANVPVLGWYVPTEVAMRLNGEFAAGIVPTTPVAGDLHVRVDRTSQTAAFTCHHSQSDDLPVVRRMVELLGDREYLRPLVRTSAVSEPPQRHEEAID